MLWGVASLALLAAPPAGAHVVYEREGLRQFVQRSELALVIEFVSVVRLWRAPDGSDYQEYFTVKVVEALKGTAPSARIDFFPHAEGFPGFQKGDQAVLFLERTAAQPEFFALAERFPWFSVQGAGQEWRVESDRDELVAVVREYLALARAESAVVRERFPTLLLRELRSADPRLREEGLRELVRVRGVATFLRTPQELEPFAAAVSDPKIPLSTRITLALVLDGRHGFAAGLALRPMTQQPLTPRQRSSLVRASGGLRDPVLSAWLAQELRASETRLRREAATALAHPWHAPQVEALVEASHEADPHVARAALRALAEIGTDEARSVLRQVSTDVSSPYREVASAELRRIGASD